MSENNKLSLWGISQTIAELNRIADDPDATEQEREVARNQITEWTGAALDKVDGVRAWLKHCKVMAAAAREEKKIQAAREEMWENRYDRMENIVLQVLDERRLKEIEGNTGSLKSVSVGGRLALELVPELVPNEYKHTTVTFQYPHWNRYMRASRASVSSEAQVEDRIDQDLIRKTMETPCPNCTSDVLPTAECILCGGTGKKIVPGARFKERGITLRIK